MTVTEVLSPILRSDKCTPLGLDCKCFIGAWRQSNAQINAWPKDTRVWLCTSNNVINTSCSTSEASEKEITPLLVAEYRKSREGLDKIDILGLGLWYVYRRFPQYTTYADSYREMTSINYSNLIEFVKTGFKKIAISCFGAPLLEMKCSDSPGTKLWRENF